ncbi:hypothetical protein RUM43_003417 [Polyplax serrata]|uniref:Uncharacterized protein n=1 Tax=Polyplax serrata TaxID=468196 RepID=A0AAN8S367_POLSC
MGVLRPGKLLPNVLIAPLHSKQPINVDDNPEDVERKENITAYRGGSRNSILINRKEAGPSHSKRALRVSSGLQVRGGVGSSRPVKSLKKSIYWTDKVLKFKQFNPKTEGSAEETVAGDSDNDRRPKLSSSSDQCLFKQSPKRLKISKGDDSAGGKIKVSEWSKDDVLPGPSCSDMVAYSRLNRSAVAAGGSSGVCTGGEGKKRLSGKAKQQLTPLKFKKSLEKRRGSDASRKKSKTLFKKSGKIILTNNDLNKNSVERKRRKN